MQPNPVAVFPPGVLALASSWSAQSSPTVPGDVVVFAEIVAAQIVLRGSLARVAPLTAIVAVISIPLPLGEPPANPLNPFPAPKLAPPANNEAPPSPENHFDPTEKISKPLRLLKGHRRNYTSGQNLLPFSEGSQYIRTIIPAL